jgi:hypothetical protein
MQAGHHIYRSVGFPCEGKVDGGDTLWQRKAKDSRETVWRVDMADSCMVVW